jgi:DNA-directed RNA polymerase specialized sigma24 family protein
MAGSITGAIHGLKQGNPEAQVDLERKLQPFLLELIALVRRHRDRPLQARIDSEGVVYHALHSFLTGVARDEFPVLESRVDVKKILTTLVRRTLCDEVRWHKRGVRTPDREHPSPDGQPRHLADPRDVRPEADALVPDVTAWMENVLAVLRPVHEKAIEIVELSFKGLSNSDIARQVGLGVRRVQVLKKDMYRLLQENAAAGND